MNVDTLKGLARCKWVGIFESVGIKIPMPPGTHGACPICRDGRDRFRLDKDTSDGSWFCSQCSPHAGDGISLVQKVLGLTFPETLERINEIVGTVEFKPVETKKNDEETKRYMNDLWKKSKPISGGDIGAKYLRSRGIMILPDPSQVRVCMTCEEQETSSVMPAIVSLVRSNEDGKGIGLHRTYLSADGLKKAEIKSPRKSLGKIGGGSIRLTNEFTETIGVAEGIETALSAQQLTGIPCWAAIDANGMEAFQPPTGESFKVRKVVIFGDNDATFTGQCAAYKLAKSLYVKDFIVKVDIPDFQGMDWNDVLVKSK